MRAAAKYSLLALALLAVSLGPKLAVELARGVPDEARFQAEIGAKLEQRGFDLRPITITNAPALLATNGACEMLVGNVQPRGYQRDRYAQWAEPIGPLRYFYRGEWSNDIPRVRPVVQSRLDRIVHGLGRQTTTAPVIAVATSRGCSADPIDWVAMRMHYRTREDG